MFVLTIVKMFSWWRLEQEKLLESKACLQDSYDNLQEVMKFEIDQLSKNLQNCKNENETLKSDLNVS